MYRMFIAIAMLAAPALAANAFSPAETAAIYKGAGLAMRGMTPVDCASSEREWPRSLFAIEAIDLNADGKPEAVLTEGNIACYGGDEAGVTILSRNPDGSWRRLAQSTGAIRPLKTRHNGWLDVENGGPGMAKPPVLIFDGKVYK